LVNCLRRLSDDIASGLVHKPDPKRIVKFCTIISLDLVKANTLDGDFGPTTSGTHLRAVPIDKVLLQVSKGVFYVSIVESLIVDKLLSIETDSHGHCVGNESLRGDYSNVGVIRISHVLGYRAISDSYIADSRLLKSLTSNIATGVSGHRACVRPNDFHLRVNIVLELVFIFCEFPAVEGQTHKIEWGCVPLSLMTLLEGRAIALNQCFVHYSGVHLDGIVKNALDLSETHINEVFPDYG
jgi:hypothetical protein